MTRRAHAQETTSSSLIVLYAILLMGRTEGVEAAAPQWQSRSFAESSEISRNPGMGLCFMPSLAERAGDMPAWILQTASIAYFRLDWADVVDSAGRYRFDELDREVFSGYRAAGLRTAFRIMGANRHSDKQAVFPGVQLGSQAATIEHLSFYGKKQADPVFWDARYVAEHGRLMSALGEYVRRHPEIDLVDLGGMGQWGEMHLIDWSANDLASTGYTPQAYLAAATEMMRQAEEELPHAVRAFCVSPLGVVGDGFIFEQLVDRAVRNNWWLRTDGFSAAGAPPYAMPFLRAHWDRVGIILEPAGAVHRDHTGAKTSVRPYVSAARKTRPSIVNLMGLWDIRDFTPDDIVACRELAMELGYRFVVQSCTLPRSVSGDRFALRLTLVQRGLSRFFGTATFRLGFWQDGVERASTHLFPPRPLSELESGDVLNERYVVATPSGLKAGKVSLRLSLEDIERGPILLANAGCDPGGLLLGEVDWGLPAGSPADRIDILAKGPSRISTAQGVSVHPVAAGMAITGIAREGWSYLSADRVDATTDKLYRMRLRIRARTMDVPRRQPYVHFAVLDHNGGWLRNRDSSPYDFSKPWTWQELTVEYSTSSKDDATLVPVLGKGGTEALSIDAEIAGWTVDVLPLP